MIRLTKKLENKFFVDSLEGEKTLNCEAGYRLVTIKVFDCLEAEGIKLSEILVDLYSEEVTMYLYDYSFYCEDDKFFEFQVCIDEEYIKEFNKLYREFKKSVDDLLETEEEEEILKAEEEIIETEEDVILEEVIEVKKEAKKETKYQIGQYLYNCGDMANDSGWYKITNVTIDKFGIFYEVEEIGGNRKNNYPEYCISNIDRMNGSTRIVTMEAKIKATNESYVYNQINVLLGKDHDERMKVIDKGYDERMKLIEEEENNNNESTEEVKKDHDKEWYQITDHEEEEKKEIINNLVETCNAGIKTEKEIKIYFNRLAKDQRTKVLNKFQREKKGLDINLFYYSTFLNEEFYLSELQEIRSKIVKYIDFLNSFKNSIIEEVNNYQEQIKNFKKEPNFKILKDEDFKIVKLNSDITFGNGNLCYIDEYTLYHKDLGYASMNGKTPYIPEGGRVALNDLINEKIIDSIPHWIKSTNFFKYTYRSRGFSPSCQPMNGLINHENQKEYKFEVLTYNRKLTCKEIAEFELIDLNRG
ncbi:hypothetical protein [Arcobacter sp.]|uniref:defense against restriction DarA-related protein n=1 Tax=Arcobacter sp. TaxID=1872629 RepID=UPI003D13E338